MSNGARVLNLGCGNRPLKGAVNHDREKYADHVDVWWDLEMRHWSVELAKFVSRRQIEKKDVWGLVADDGQYLKFSEVHARDVLEHIRPDHFYQVMDEIWLLLEPGGLCHIQVPMWGSINAIIDPTHWRGFHLDSFDYLDPTTRLGKACWTTKCRWKIMNKAAIPKTSTNFKFELKKIQ